MIRVHFHKRKDTQYCHVYSDLCVRELKVWMLKNNVPLEWLQNTKFPHVDLWGGYLIMRAEEIVIVTNREFVDDARKLCIIKSS